MAGYQNPGPMDCTVDVDTSTLRGKNAVVTGGANGIGEAYVRALVAAGTTVTIGDLDVARGSELAAAFPNQIHFVECNTTRWDDQLRLFSEAASFSPTGAVHYVVANAGIITPDDVFSFADPPTEPDLRTIDVNIRGTLYTTKLAMHHFVKQNGTTPSPAQQQQQHDDTCLVLIGSGAAIHDCLRIPQYSASKWAARGIMHALRRTAFFYRSRVNVVNPWYVKTSILSDADFEHVRSRGVEFAAAEDAGRCLLRILADDTVNGRSLFVAPRKWAPNGYVDLDLEGTEESALRAEIQRDQMLGAPVEMGLFA